MTIGKDMLRYVKPMVDQWKLGGGIRFIPHVFIPCGNADKLILGKQLMSLVML